MLTEDDVKGRPGERQVGDVCLAHGDPVVQADKSIEPTGRFAVLLGEIDGGNPALAMVCDETCSAADPRARIEYFRLTCDAAQLHQLGCCHAAHRVEVLEQPKIRRRKMAEVLSCGNEGLLDAASRDARRVLAIDLGGCHV